jgi:hypothetical protein
MATHKKTRNKDWTWGKWILALALVSAFSLFLVYQAEAPTAEKILTEIKKETPTPTVEKLPDSKLIAVPYTVQAPFGNWKVHEESCEEAALLMYHQFLVGDKSEQIDQHKADTELRAMKDWQVKHYDKEPDLTIARLGEFTKSYYGHTPTVKNNVTEEDIKKEIAAGRPVMVPVMTQSLKNPHYSPGNVYHILLIKGYDQTGVITNDAGVKEGMNWHYDWNTLWSAIDAQTTKMNQGRTFLVLSN